MVRAYFYGIFILHLERGWEPMDVGVSHRYPIHGGRFDGVD